MNGDYATATRSIRPPDGLLLERWFFEISGKASSDKNFRPPTA
jgi:hypothetical protein